MKNIIFFLIAIFIIFSLDLNKANDFLTFLDVGKIVNQRGAPSSPSNTTGMYVFYLPFFSYLFSILCTLPIKLVWIFWTFLKLGGVFFFIQSIPNFLISNSNFRTLNWKWSVGLSFLLTIGFFDADLKLGQVNILIFLSILFSVYYFEKNQYFKSSLFFHFACLKLTPFIFLPYYIIKSRGKYLKPLSLIFSFYYFMGAILYNSFLKPFEQLQDLFILITREKTNDESVIYYKNQSFIGFLKRSFPEFNSTIHFSIWFSVLIGFFICGFIFLKKAKN